MFSSIMSHLPLVGTILLVTSEALASVTQVVFPNNAGVSGIMAGIIKMLQAAGAKD